MRLTSRSPLAAIFNALTNAQPGDTILLTAGATYTGNFTLPDKGGAIANGHG